MFAAIEDALAWLEHLQSQDSEIISQLRKYLTGYSWDDQEIPHLDDPQGC